VVRSARRSCGAPFLEALKAKLDGALGSLSWWGAALPMTRAEALRDFRVPSNPSLSVSLILIHMGSGHSSLRMAKARSEQNLADRNI